MDVKTLINKLNRLVEDNPSATKYDVYTELYEVEDLVVGTKVKNTIFLTSKKV